MQAALALTGTKSAHATKTPDANVSVISVLKLRVCTFCPLLYDVTRN